MEMRRIRFRAWGSTQAGVKVSNGSINPVKSTKGVGEPREIMLARALKSGQPINGDITTTYITDDEGGVIPGTDIRMDRMELAQETMAKYGSKASETKNPAQKDMAGVGNTNAQPPEGD